MSNNVRIVLIGKYQPDLVKYLSYVEEFYKKTLPGSVVITDVLYCPTSHIAAELAVILGVTDMDDMGQHHIKKNQNIDYTALSLLDNSSHLGWKEDIEALRVLREHNFLTIIYLD